jgi:mono/diheme cytochrome c family protein
VRAALLVAGLALALPLAAQGDELGRKVFMELAQPPCHLCHTLKAAGAEGTIGPSLDELKPDLEKALQAVRNGVGIMPAFNDKLTAEQISAVARYVAKVAGK